MNSSNTQQTARHTPDLLSQRPLPWRVETIEAIPHKSQPEGVAILDANGYGLLWATPDNIPNPEIRSLFAASGELLHEGGDMTRRGIVSRASFDRRPETTKTRAKIISLLVLTMRN